MSEPLADVMKRYSGNKYEYHGCDKDRARLADAFCEIVPELVAALECSLDHVKELREAWRTGALSEHDGQGGTRSNRNVDVENKCRAALAKVKEAGVST